jgi:hypothetical protein
MAQGPAWARAQVSRATKAAHFQIIGQDKDTGKGKRPNPKNRGAEEKRGGTDRPRQFVPAGLGNLLFRASKFRETTCLVHPPSCFLAENRDFAPFCVLANFLLFSNRMGIFHARDTARAA